MSRIELDLGDNFEMERRALGIVPEHVMNRILNKADESALGIVQRERDKLEQRLVAMLRLSGKGAPSYALAALSTDAAGQSGNRRRPYQWVWETRYFGTMLYNYLRGARGARRLIMKDVCDQWLGHDGAPMNYNSIKAMRAAGQIPDRLEPSLARALEAAGYPYNPPATRDTRAHAVKAPMNREEFHALLKEKRLNADKRRTR